MDLRQTLRQNARGTQNVTGSNSEDAAGSREERRLMRQRGAGTRDVNNIDFGFAFASPDQVSARRSSTRSKTPAISARTPLKKSHDNIPVLASSTRSIRSQHLPSSPLRTLDTSLYEQPQRKRRRLSEVSNITKATSLGVPPTSELGNADEQIGGPLQSLHEKTNSTHQPLDQGSQFDIPSSPLFFPNPPLEEVDANKENEAAPLQSMKSLSKKRKRRSIGQQSLFKKKKKKRSSDSFGTSVIDLPNTQEDMEPGGAESNDLSVPFNRSSPGLAVESPRGNTPLASAVIPSHRGSTLNTIRQTKHKKKRKSITGVKRRRRLDLSASIPSPELAQSMEAAVEDDSTRVTDSNRDSNIDPHFEQLFTGEHNQVPPSPSLKSISERTQEINVGDNEVGDETYLPNEATPEPTPAPRRTRKNQNRRRAGRSTASARESTGQRRGSPCPILTHRVMNAHTLPTIVEENGKNLDIGEDASSADELSLAPPTILTRSTPNAVDVLAQVCRETVDAYSQKLKEESSGHARSDRSRQIKALEMLRSKLDNRLFDLSQSLDQRLHMEARLRKSRREKADLQARWLEVRKQRDLMALRMDAVRRQHWEDEVLSRKSWDISQTANRLEVAINKDEHRTDDEQESKPLLLEFSLKKLARDVSSMEDGGTLNTIRHFNAQLDRLAAALS